jgi:hypothetical protein
MKFGKEPGGANRMMKTQGARNVPFHFSLVDSSVVPLSFISPVPVVHQTFVFFLEGTAATAISLAIETVLDRHARVEHGIHECGDYKSQERPAGTKSTFTTNSNAKRNVPASFASHHASSWSSSIDIIPIQQRMIVGHRGCHGVVMFFNTDNNGF